jgi:P-type Cu2+ transporter
VGTAPPTALADCDLKAYQLHSVEQTLTAACLGTQRTARMTVNGMRCAGCAWLVKKLLEGCEGVTEARINFALRRAEVGYDASATDLHALLKALSDAGYAARPYTPANEEKALDAERLTRLRGLGFSALLGMQVMAASIALHLGDWFGMQDSFRTLFRWLSLVLTIPVLIWPARQFFSGARVAFANWQLTMDVPIAIGLGLAFAGSVHATLSGAGAVYYDSIVMFVLLLSGARYLELLARRRTGARIRALAQCAPLSALRKGDNGANNQRVVATELEAGDVVIVAPGELVPADGVLVQGASSVDQSILTGESLPQRVGCGDRVIAGSTNHVGVIEIQVDEAGDATVLARLTALAERAARGRNKVGELADRAAAWFVGTTLIVATSVAVFWFHFNHEIWIAATVSVLVVTCPCALSLATPAAMTAALAALARRGLLPAKADVIERLGRVTHLVIDKTGTLTQGRLQVGCVQVEGDSCEISSRRIAALLELHATHPVGMALRNGSSVDGHDAATDVVMSQDGVHGGVDGQHYWLGSRQFIHAQTGLAVGMHQQAGPSGTHVYLVTHAGRGRPHPAPATQSSCCATTVAAPETNTLPSAAAIIATFTLTDTLRAGAQDLMRRLSACGIGMSIASGDEAGAVEDVAKRVGAHAFVAELSPQDKLAYVARLQADGHHVAVLGDGVNDAPVLASADLGVAVGTGTQVAHANADAVLTSPDLNAMVDALLVARRTRQIIKHNLVWAALYNVMALPAAAAGVVPPWLAAIGMSLSSLVVVGNALRIR